MRLSIGLLFLACAVCGCGGGDGSGGTSAAAGSAAGSGTGTGTGTGSGSGSGTAGGPTLKQWTTYQTADDPSVTENNSTLQFKSLTVKGDTLWVVATVPTYGGVHTISVTDSQGNTFMPLEQEDDVATGATQSVAHFYATNIAGDTSTPDVVTVIWGNDNYKGILISEISGVSTASLVGQSSNIQDGLGAGANNVTSGPITVASAQTPALLLALSVNTSGGISDTGGSGAPGPAAGSGMTSQGAFWDWGANLATFVTASISSAESASAVFNAPDTDSYVTVAAVFH